MNPPFRKIIFWTHLVAGLVAGLVIGVMSLTGTLLAFEKELVVWSERDARTVTVPANAARLEVETLLDRARAAAGGGSPTTVVVPASPAEAVTVAFGRDKTYFVNPYTGEALQPRSTAVHDTLHVIEEWHRFLGLSGDSRPAGKLINGFANLCFFVLAVTGLYIWWPRRWEWRAVRGAVWFTRGASGKARDWNWHNVIGLWFAPILIVLTLTAVPISFRWASNGIYRLFGEAPPVQQGPAAAPAVMVTPPASGAQRLKHGDLLAAVQRQSPAWETITLRLGGQARPAGSRPAGPTDPNGATAQPQGSRSAAPGSVPATTVIVKERAAWPLFATVQYAIDPFTGAVLKRDGYENATPARKVRSWTRFLHTGEAFGTVGKLLAGLASAGGVVLVYTGFALSWRRFFRRTRPLPPSPAASDRLASASR